jgi:UPF0716 protein FxsA
MPVLLVLAFVIVPLVELVVIIQVAGVVGTPWTIALLVVDSLIGAYLLKRESRRAWRDFRAALSAGRFPGDEVTQGALVIVGGTLLLTPGFVTDVVGLLCLLPPSRAAASRVVRRRIVPGAVLGGAANRGRTPGSAAPGGTSAGRHAAGPPTGEGGQVYDVEVVDVQREPPPDPEER